MLRFLINKSCVQIYFLEYNINKKKWVVSLLFCTFFYFFFNCSSQKKDSIYNFDDGSKVGCCSSYLFDFLVMLFHSKLESIHVQQKFVFDFQLLWNHSEHMACLNSVLKYMHCSDHADFYVNIALLFINVNLFFPTKSSLQSKATLPRIERLPDAQIMLLGFLGDG